MILNVSKEYYGPAVPIPFPAAAERVREELDKLNADGQPLFIRGDGPVWHFEDWLDPAELYRETGVEKLNRLAALVDAMDLTAQKVFAGALRAESVGGLDDILDIASNLAQYEFIEGVTSDKELGGWLVEHGLAEVNFPKEVWPYLDYAGIGAAYYAGHGGAYTPNGYAKRRENVQTQAEEVKGPLALTLASPTASVRLQLPAPEEQMEAAKRALGLNSLGNAAIRDVEIDYPWAHLLPLDSITLEDANTLAECVLDMTPQGLRLFGAALEVEEPPTFRAAGTIAMDLDDYELVDPNEGEYGREALRYAGASDEILEMLEGFTDFDALGRTIGGPGETQRSGFAGERSRSEASETCRLRRGERCVACGDEADGVRGTSFGSIKRLSAPFPQPYEEPGMEMR